VTDRQTDRQTDGIAIASTALAMRALRRTVKYEIGKVNYSRVLEKSLMYVLYYTVFQKKQPLCFLSQLWKMNTIFTILQEIFYRYVIETSTSP